MKVIDLLNKIANGEQVPKKIMYNNIIYNWDIVGYLHYEDEYHSERAFLEGYRTDMCLNDEIEIIEDTPKEVQVLSRWYPPKEDKKIAKIGKLNQVSNNKQHLNNYILRNKINEIIDRLNGEDNEV